MTYLQRKKLAFMSIVNSVKGFVRTVSGTLPLTLPDCVDTNSLIRYTINGNGVGDYDESTGKYKIPIKCGVKNLFDVDRWYEELTANCTHTYNPYFGTKDGYNYIAVRPPANVRFMEGEFKENTQYTLSFMVSSDQSNYTGLVIVYTDNTKTNIYAPKNWTKRTLTTDVGKTISYIGVYFYNGAYAYYADIQLEEGTKATDYEPYVEPVTTNIYLDEPLTEGETLKNPIKLPTFKGTTVYTIGTSIQPSNMSATYYATSKE